MPKYTRKVVVLRDFSYAQRSGEEELAIDRFLQAAPEDVDIHVQPPENLQLGFKRDDVVVSFGLKRYPDKVFEWLLKHPRHIHVSQDWWDPMQSQSEWRNQIIQSAARVIFMSPMHRERYERIYQVTANHTLILPFPMLESDHHAWVREFDKEDAVLWCAPWHPDYGNDIMLKWAARKEKTVHAYGLGVPTEQIMPRVEGHGPIALEAAAPAFLQYSRFAFFPRTPVPFGFAFLLAYMLGLEVTYSGEIGCLSWECDLDTLANPHCVPETFWNTVEEVAA